MSNSVTDDPINCGFSELGLPAEEHDPLRHMIEERSREKLSLHWSQLIV